MKLKSQDIISDSYPHIQKAVSVWDEFLKNLMLNLKNNENDAVFEEI